MYQLLIEENGEFRMKFPIGSPDSLHIQVANEMAHGLAEMIIPGRSVTLLSPKFTELVRYSTGGLDPINRDLSEDMSNNLQ